MVWYHIVRIEFLCCRGETKHEIFSADGQMWCSTPQFFSPCLSENTSEKHQAMIANNYLTTSCFSPHTILKKPPRAKAKYLRRWQSRLRARRVHFHHTTEEKAAA